VVDTAALAALIYGVSDAETAGWTSSQTLASLVGAGVLAAMFAAVEACAASPLAPLWVLARWVRCCECWRCLACLR
jgi:hypothetical protein